MFSSPDLNFTQAGVNVEQGLSVAHFNARSIPAHIDDIRVLTDNYNYDIIIVTETWLFSSASFNLFNLPGYIIFRNDRKTSRGGGIAIYVKDCFNVVTLNFPTTNSIEQLWISIKLGNNNVIVSGIYRPSHRIPYSNLDCLYQPLDYCNLNASCIIMAGDFNIDQLDTTDPSVAYLLNITTTFNLTQIVSQATRITDSSSTLLDLIFVSHCDKVSNITHMPLAFSDHDLVDFFCAIPSVKQRSKFITRRRFNNINLNLFSRDASAAGWDAVYDCTNIDAMVDTFNKIIINLFNKHAPLKTFKVKHLPAPWLTDDIKNKFKERDLLLCKYRKLKKKKSNNDSSVLLAKENFVIAKNNCNKLIRRAKKLFFEQHINNNLHNSKKLWASLKYLGVISGQSDSNVSFKPNINDLNSYFNSNYNLPIEKDLIDAEIQKISQCSYYPSFILQHVNTDDVWKIFSSISTNAQGVDHINKVMLSYCLPFTIFHITYIINYSISSNTFPDLWKQAYILPTPKLESPTQLKDFRPISILPCLSKILEKVVASQLCSYFDNHNFFNFLQSGFRKNHSTASALLKIITDIINSLDQNDITILTLLDYSKAFDTVNHELLLAKLKHFGFMDQTLQWFKSYLSDRNHSVTYNNQMSSWLTVSNGVPQESILGPILFISIPFVC